MLSNRDYISPKYLKNFGWECSIVDWCEANKIASWQWFANHGTLQHSCSDSCGMRKLVTTGFSTLNSNWGKRTCKRPIWLDNCARLGISWELLACCGKGICHGFQSAVGAARTEIRTLRELGLHTFILRTSLHLLAVQLLMLNHKT